ncbi:uncharacterized protein ACLA_072690 [Aspergillus clavatus NRRL 1]|uniref:Glycoprotease family protein n=1 Tax=Aspergillus clavatus (strain ATCC 1007 / CBS 513.65 / DSM 816 / NCTC 3887 / NRRL 1 / QM 1276 / 107) TaxID=344612 RepID=A1C765_ASPCL|nr:uncharacterized protein ACLA_072690 [Aspergillus clavatus NRRL 1]EAW14236.1 conserved hypothetical protein [Aspergillus clavatus NRRL 1]
MAPRSKPDMQLRIPQIPNFPFSSPITEEIASPAASSDEDREMERSRPFDYLAKAEKNPSQKAEFTGSQRDRSVEREIRVFDAGLAEKNGSVGSGAAAKKVEKLVGLNLVTDFGVLAKENRDGEARPAFVDLHDLKVLARMREKERSAQKVRGILKNGPAAQGFQRLPGESEGGRRRLSWLGPSRIGSLRRKYRDELSPSDRPIMIGYSVPIEESIETQNEEGGVRGLERAESQRTPLTPSIVVTPARDDSFWNGLAPELHRPRAASSVYSPRTSFLGSARPDIPPVPAIPASHVEAKDSSPRLSSPPRGSIISTRRQRSFSTGTVFEDDDGPRQSLRARSYSTESSRRGQDRLSVLTDYNRHQSQGWWTYLLSPVLGRSSTIARTPTRTERPTIPTIVTNSTVSSDEWWEKEVSYFSPDTPETAAATRSAEVNWQDTPTNPFADASATQSEEFERSFDTEKEASSFMFSGGTIQGAAAEYYQACAHELFSGRPYFECINHVCSITPKDKIPVLLADAIAKPPSNEKNLLIDVDDEDNEPQPGARSCAESVSHSGARVMSGSTAVGDAPDSPVGKEKQKAFKEIIEESPRSSPLPELDDRAPPPWVTERLPEKQDSHLFFQPTNTVAPAVNNIHIQAPTPVQPAAVAPLERIVPHYIVVPPPNYAHPQPPDPTSPGLQQATVRSGSIPLSDMASGPAPVYASQRTASPELPPRMGPAPVTREQMTHPWVERERIEGQRRRLEKEDALGRKAGGLWRGRGCFSKKGCFGKPGREGRLRRRWYMAITTFFVLIVTVAIVLAIMLTRKGDDMPVQSQWLNLTGYPPMPTGIATIAGSELRDQNSGCITPSSLWSCALPPEQQSDNKPYAANQPSFRVEIRFRNGTYANSTTVASPQHKARDASSLFNPSPPPPSVKDQTFLGNTTDENATPYAGEETPFFLTLLSTAPISSAQHLSRRSNNSSFPDIESLIPAPALNSDGTAAPAALHPFPTSQPIRLYNRGLETEHYGFYTYFDRSIFLSTTAPLTGKPDPTNPSDANGGTAAPAAHTRCTWAQTRFLVQIWTQPARLRRSLLPSPSTSASATATPSASAPRSSSTSPSSSATDFVRPGSFPYPVTVTLDRHGGVVKDKMVYCYAVEELHVNATAKKLQVEDRGFGGGIVNPAPGLFNLSSVGEMDLGDGGFDGGAGGCSCQWANWVAVS